jgi:hypothetical protein
MPAAYVDENGKWWKECSTSKQLFGGVDTQEELGQWFRQGKNKDGFRSECKEVEKQYYQENKDKINEKRKRDYQNNPDKIKEKNKQYRQNNPDKIKEKDKKYHQSPAGLYTQYKRSAKRRGIPYTLTEEWFEEQMKLPQFNICAVSGRTFVDEPNHPHSRTLDRVSSTKGYTPDNLKWVCRIYNSWKNDLKLQEIFEIAKYACEHHNIDPVKYMESIVYGKDNPHLAAK